MELFEIENLSEKEKAILILICQEKSNAEISKKLYVSQRTVEWHKNHLLAKTGSKNIVGLVKFAIRNNVISLNDKKIKTRNILAKGFVNSFQIKLLTTNRRIKKTPGKIKIIIVETNETKEGYTTILKWQNKIITDKVKNKKELFIFLKKRKPDIVIYDSSTKFNDFRETIKQIFKISESTKELMSENENSEMFMEFNIKTSAKDYYDKIIDCDFFIDSIKTIHEGKTLITRNNILKF